MKPGQELTELNDKVVDEIYFVDFNDHPESDNYLPWIFFITFTNADIFLEIEAGLDAEHIKIYWRNLSTLGQKLKDFDHPNEPDLWRVYRVRDTEKLGSMLDGRIMRVEYGVDKDEFEINGLKIRGQKDMYTFIKFYFEETFLMIFEGGTGLYATDDPAVKPCFEEKFDTFNTR
jgi:hypothetical protein